VRRIPSNGELRTTKNRDNPIGYSKWQLGVLTFEELSEGSKAKGSVCQGHLKTHKAGLVKRGFAKRLPDRPRLNRGNTFHQGKSALIVVLCKVSG